MGSIVNPHKCGSNFFSPGSLIISPMVKISLTVSVKEEPALVSMAVRQQEVLHQQNSLTHLESMHCLNQPICGLISFSSICLEEWRLSSKD